MKKILGIVVLVLLWSGSAFSKTINSYEDLDLTSKPKKVLSKSKTKALWNAFRKAKECFEHPTYGEGFGYKLKKHSGASKRFKKSSTSLKSRSANRNHILSKQSTKRKRHNRGLNKMSGTVLKMASRLINR